MFFIQQFGPMLDLFQHYVSKNYFSLGKNSPYLSRIKKKDRDGDRDRETKEKKGQNRDSL